MPRKALIPYQYLPPSPAEMNSLGQDTGWELEDWINVLPAVTSGFRSLAAPLVP